MVVTFLLLCENSLVFVFIMKVFFFLHFLMYFEFSFGFLLPYSYFYLFFSLFPSSIFRFLLPSLLFISILFTIFLILARPSSFFPFFLFYDVAVWEMRDVVQYLIVLSAGLLSLVLLAPLLRPSCFYEIRIVQLRTSHSTVLKGHHTALHSRSLKDVNTEILETTCYCIHGCWRNHAALQSWLFQNIIL